MEHPVEQPLEQSDFDYEKAMLKVVFEELVYESAVLVDQDWQANTHVSSTTDKTFFSVHWRDENDVFCSLRSHSTIVGSTALDHPDTWQLKTEYYFSYEDRDSETRRFYYSTADPYKVYECNEFNARIKSKFNGSDYEFACEILSTLRSRQERQTFTDSERMQLQLYALDYAVSSPDIQDMIADVDKDTYGKHASKATVAKVIELVLAKEPTVDVSLAEKRIREEIRMRDAA